MATETGPAEGAVIKPADGGLKREVGFIGAVWSSESSIIGSGWLFGALYAAQVAGPSAIIAWIIGGVIFAFLALVHAELGAMYPVAGGTARFPHFAFGTVAGTSFGFFSWIQAVTVAPVECFAVMNYGQYWANKYHWIPTVYNPTTSNVTTAGFIISIVLMVIFTGLNFFGIKWLSRVNSALMWWKVAIPVLAIIVLATQWHSSNFGSAAGGFFPGGAKGIMSAVASAGIAFAYLGFEQADQLAGEIKNPQKNLPRAILTAVAIGTAIYILLQVAFIAAMDPHLLTTAHGWLGMSCPKTGACNPQIADVNSGPFAAVATIAALGWLATFLRIDAFISPFGTGLIYLTSSSRVTYGVAKNRYFPAVLAKVDKRGVPWISLILAFVGGLIFLLPFPSWHSLVGLITGASVLMYAGAPLALGAFRGQVPEAERPYRLGGAAVISPLAFVLANFIIYWSGLEVIWKLGVVLVIGYVVIAVCMAFDRDRPKLDAKNWKAASWLPVYLIGMGLISWGGQYSGGAVLPPVNTNFLPLWIDLLVVAVFSLVIYFWAMAVKLPREEMLELVAKQGSDDPAADAAI